jgi:hypothetical protein
MKFGHHLKWDEDVSSVGLQADRLLGEPDSPSIVLVVRVEGNGRRVAVDRNSKGLRGLPPGDRSAVVVRESDDRPLERLGRSEFRADGVEDDVHGPGVTLTSDERGGVAVASSGVGIDRVTGRRSAGRVVHVGIVLPDLVVTRGRVRAVRVLDQELSHQVVELGARGPVSSKTEERRNSQPQ